jgi:hypothetical protein
VVLSSLISDLESYSEMNKKVKDLILKLNKLNENGTPNLTDFEKSVKLYLISEELDKVNIDQKKYIYLDKLMKEIYELKRKDVDADVSSFLKKL